MKVLVVLLCVAGFAAARPGFLGYAGVPVAAAGGPADTPEVAAAKSRILAIQAAEAARNSLGVPVVPAAAPAAPVAAYGAANIVIGPGGVPLDTPEVAAAKAANAAAHAAASAQAATAPAPALLGVGYGLGVPGAVHVAPDGTLLTSQGVPLDTPAVAAGRIADAVAHLQAKAALLG